MSKAFAIFEIKSLLPPLERSLEHQSVTTAPSDTGSNPNINSVIDFSAKLPDEELHCPMLTVVVKDMIFLGLSQPIIGTFDIPIGEVINSTKANDQAMVEKSNAIVSILQSISRREEIKGSDLAVFKDEVEMKRLSIVDED